MKKQLLLFILALLPMLAMADDSGKCGDNVTYYYSSSTQTLTIQGTGAIKNYVTFPWNSYKDDIITIVIEDGVTSIGNRAFYDCSGLTSVTIPNSVTSIGGGAFYGTAWYNNQPDGLIYAGKVAYTYKGTMPENTSITIKDGTLVIAESAFQDRSGLTSVTIPNSVTSIGNRAFYGCSVLTSVTIGTGVTSIGKGAFSGCSGLTSVTINSNAILSSSGNLSNIFGSQVKQYIIGNSVTSIGSYAFQDCSGLNSVTIPNSVTRIGEYAFDGCSGLASVTINNDAILSKAYTSLSNLSHIFGSQVKQYIIGNSVTSIGEYNQEIKGKTNVEIIPVSA